MRKKKMFVLTAAVLLIIFCAAFVRAQEGETDVEGSKDNPC